VATPIFSARLLLEGHFYIYIKERDTFRSGTVAGKIGVRFNSQSCHSGAQAVAFDFRYVAVLKSRMFRLSRVSSALFFLEPADIVASRILRYAKVSFAVFLLAFADITASQMRRASGVSFALLSFRTLTSIVLLASRTFRVSGGSFARRLVLLATSRIRRSSGVSFSIFFLIFSDIAA
jgi:hypothetical protein